MTAARMARRENACVEQDKDSLAICCFSTPGKLGKSAHVALYRTHGFPSTFFSLLQAEANTITVGNLFNHKERHSGIKQTDLQLPELLKTQLRWADTCLILTLKGVQIFGSSGTPHCFTYIHFDAFLHSLPQSILHPFLVSSLVLSLSLPCQFFRRLKERIRLLRSTKKRPRNLPKRSRMCQSLTDTFQPMLPLMRFQAHHRVGERRIAQPSKHSINDGACYLGMIAVFRLH